MTNHMSDPLNMIGFEPVVVQDVPISLEPAINTQPINQRPKHALIQVKTAAIRWLAVPGEQATALRGFYVPPGGTIDWTDMEANFAALIENVTFIRAGAVAAELEVGYFA